MSQPAEVCREIYAETRNIYESVAGELGNAALGFRVLYGPPIKHAPYLFLGFQPGGKADQAEIGIAEGHHEGWPPRSDYALAEWSLACKMRFTWGQDVIERCPGLNAIFFRSPSMKAWAKLPSRIRDNLERFSLKRAERIVELLAPDEIVVIGFGTFDRLVDRGVIGLVGDKGRVLTKTGELWGRPATAVVHLSGSRISRSDRERLRDHFQSASIA